MLNSDFDIIKEQQMCTLTNVKGGSITSSIIGTNSLAGWNRTASLPYRNQKTKRRVVRYIFPKTYQNTGRAKI